MTPKKSEPILFIEIMLQNESISIDDMCLKILGQKGSLAKNRIMKAKRSAVDYIHRSTGVKDAITVISKSDFKLNDRNATQTFLERWLFTRRSIS